MDMLSPPAAFGGGEPNASSGVTSTARLARNRAAAVRLWPLLASYETTSISNTPSSVQPRVCGARDRRVRTEAWSEGHVVYAPPVNLQVRLCLRRHHHASTHAPHTHRQ